MPAQIQNQRRILIAAPADVAFQFFTPAGEQIWIDDWRPRYIHPSDGTTVAGMVFTTGEGPEHTIWQLLDFDPGRRMSRYARTTPGLRTGTVTVQATALDTQSTEVLVHYDMTALSDAGAASLEQYLDPAFAQALDAWGEKIRRRLPQLLQAFGRS